VSATRSRSSAARTKRASSGRDRRSTARNPTRACKTGWSAKTGSHSEPAPAAARMGTTPTVPIRRFHTSLVSTSTPYSPADPPVSR